MTDETYNGWKNYPTWCVNMWLSNDEGMYNEALERTQAAMESSTPNVLTGGTTVRYDVAEDLKTWVRDVDDDGGLSPILNGFASDLYSYALQCVDWYEIADAWIEQVTENA